MYAELLFFHRVSVLYSELWNVTQMKRVKVHSKVQKEE
jgi:hypothetical protein